MPARIPDKALLADLRKVAARLGRQTLKKKDYDQHGQYSAATIANRCGGWNQALKKARLQPARQKHAFGYWKRWNNVSSELSQLKVRLGHYPSGLEIRRYGFHGLYHAIHRYYGGLRAVRQRLGETSDRMTQPPQYPRGYWSDLGNIDCHLREVEGKLKHFPTWDDLETLGFHGLLDGIKRSGGMKAARKRLGLEIPLRQPKQQKIPAPTHRVVRSGRYPRGYLSDSGNIKQELLRLKGQLGHFPRTGELRKLNISLLKAIERQHLSLRVLRHRLESATGPEPTPLRFGFWKKFDHVKSVLEQYIEQLGHFPTRRELIRLGRKDLVQGIARHHRGLNAIRARMGYGRPIHNTSGFVRVLEREQPQKARRVLKDLMSHFGDDLVDVADIMAVVYTGRLEAKTAMEILQDPSMRPWIVPFDGRGHGPGKPPIGDDFPFYLLEKDRNGVIAGIIRRRLTEWRRKVLGARPSAKARETFLKQLRELQNKFRTNGGKEVAPAA